MDWMDHLTAWANAEYHRRSLEQSAAARAVYGDDLAIYGVHITKDGVRVAPADFWLAPESALD